MVNYGLNTINYSYSATPELYPVPLRAVILSLYYYGNLIGKISGFIDFPD